MSTRRKYTAEFKREGRSMAAIAQELGIKPNCTWHLSGESGFTPSRRTGQPIFYRPTADSCSARPTVNDQ